MTKVKDCTGQTKSFECRADSFNFVNLDTPETLITSQTK